MPLLAGAGGGLDDGVWAYRTRREWSRKLILLDKRQLFNFFFFF